MHECGRRANSPRFQTCCGACPHGHTGECAVRNGILWCACGRKANLPRFLTCCGACPRGHSGECALREGLLGCAHVRGTKDIAPSLQSHFAAQRKDEAEVDKQRVKAREARRLRATHVPEDG